jgi:hypothetical protein
VLQDPVNGIDPEGLMCFDFDQFAEEIRENRFAFGWTATLGELTAAEAVGTMPKTASETRALGQPKDGINKMTSQLSRWSSRLNRLTNGMTGRALRNFGRTAKGVALSGAATAALIFEGFYNWTVIIKSAKNATSSDECKCNKN